ncbi:hypothetical protein CDL15_Pgr004499 [Punica granatum]|uniref:Uncharacterized protein n=1 Tax=Punica granatum TaxID=22663 RepID=A0A218WY47_PUNGR|nr:hypothetical protein CDL15_Pgr004499 [Punica granatum]
MEEKCDLVGEEEDPLREIGKLAVVSGNLEIGELEKPSPESPKILPDSDCLNAGEAPIDHGKAQAVPRAISRVHSGPYRGVQGREPPPAAPWPPLPPDPDRPWLTGLGPESASYRRQWMLKGDGYANAKLLARTSLSSASWGVPFRRAIPLLEYREKDSIRVLEILEEM